MQRTEESRTERKTCQCTVNNTKYQFTELQTFIPVKAILSKMDGSRILDCTRWFTRNRS